MAFVEARTGGPPDVPVENVVSCEEKQQEPRAYLTLQIRNRHAFGAPPLANTQVQVAVGPQQHTLDTDGNGLITFVYEANADFANQGVQVVVTDAARGWRGQGNTGNLTQVSVTVSGRFQLTVELYTHKPGTGAMAWVHAWTNNLNLTCATTPPGGAAANQNIAFQANGNNPAADEIQNSPLDCVSAHVLNVEFFGFLNTSTVEIWTEGTQRVVGVNDATHDDVTFRGSAGNGIRLAVTRHGAAVRVRFTFRFPQVLIVGEGTHFEYAVGLASKYADALANPEGFRWIVATQYDVTPVGNVSTDLRIRNWQNNHWINHANQRQNVRNALAKNLINHNAQFDATNAGHWAGTLGAYGAFDAAVFNNPHPGYGMHMCEVLGLSPHHPFHRKNGRAISVYSFGYAQALDAQALQPYTGHAHPEYYATQRTFVRGNQVGQLNYQNSRDTAIQHQHDAVHTTARNLRIRDAFVYYNAQQIDGDWYGQDGEFPNDQYNHYQSNVDTLGLQGYLLRCYRYHGMSVLKNGGWLYVNGSQTWNAALTAQFSFQHNAANHNVAAMVNIADWPTHATYFVYYRTNFTSTDHHPSWYSDPNFYPGEPNIANARVFGVQKP